MTLVWSPGYAPVDEHYDNVSLLLYGNGTNGSTTITDNSPSPKTVTAVGNAQISTAQSKFGGASIAFDGDGDQLTIPSSTAFDLGDTYTIEFWMRANSFALSSGLVHRGFYATQSQTWDGLAFSIRPLDPVMRFYFFATTNANEQYIDVTLSGNFVINTWHHVAMTRSGTTGYVFVDGVSKGTITSLNTPAASLRELKIGNWDFTTGSTVNGWFDGYIDDLRITKGVARYKGPSNFVPPTESFPDLSPTGRLALP